MIKETIGWDAQVSVINLIDIDYRYADSGGEKDPLYPSDTELPYGWLDGISYTTWGSLPYQTRRMDLADSDPSDDPDNEIWYQFDGLEHATAVSVSYTGQWYEFSFKALFNMSAYLGCIFNYVFFNI